MQRKNYRTQWTAQFFTAAELTRRGYLVSFTLGNAPEVDLLVVSPKNNQHFKIDVKGLSSRNFWLVREHEPHPNLFYVLVHIPALPLAPDFYILSSAEMMAGIKTLKDQTLTAGRRWVDSGSGLTWGMSSAFKDRWEILPE